MAESKQKTSDALRTYRYLRIGMIAAVVLLATSVVRERVDQGCWQISISAYFYTPVKSVLVGVLLAIGFAMIVIKGRNGFEDTALNFAGMFAPIVALAPTSPPRPHDADRCRVFVPSAEELAKAIDNNIWALLITGVVCLVVAFAITVVLNRDVRAPFTEVDAGTWRTLLAAFAAVAFAVVLKFKWKRFDTLAHGWAARLMFFCMFLAAMGAAYEARARAHDLERPEAERRAQRRYKPLYVVTGLGMLSGLLALPFDFGNYEVLLLEGWEIGWFGIFWALQTAERWYEPPSGSTAKVFAG
jgi:amino acid transporter